MDFYYTMPRVVKSGIFRRQARCCSVMMDAVHMYRVEFSLPFTLDCEFVVRKLLILVHQASRSMFTEDGIINNEDKTAA